MQNKKAALYQQLLTPSALRAVFYTFLAGMVLLLNQFDFIRHYLQLPDNFNLSGILLSWADSLTTRILGKTHTEAVVLGLFWGIVGLAVYLFLWGIARFASELSEGMDERRYYLWPQGSRPDRVLRETMLRGVLRLGAFIGLLIVVLGLLPRELHGTAGRGSVLLYAGWFIGLWSTLHLIVVLLRLITLKPRIFG